MKTTRDVLKECRQHLYSALDMNRKIDAMLAGETCEIDGAVLDRIRSALLFGQHARAEDVLVLFEATTGEKIERGKRCSRCGGDAKVPAAIARPWMRPHGSDWVWSGKPIEYGPGLVDCPACKGSPGYEVLPSWMRKEDGELCE